MKESVLDVLMYMFESYMDDEPEVELDRETLQARLLEAGFNHAEIGKAFDWLEGLPNTDNNALASPRSHTMRLYHSSEKDKIGRDCQGFLIFLEQSGVLDATSREMVIDRVMALDTDEIDLEQLKWVTLMVLFNLPGEETAYHWLEDMVMEDRATYLH